MMSSSSESAGCACRLGGAVRRGHVSGRVCNSTRSPAGESRVAWLGRRSSVDGAIARAAHLLRR